MMASISWFQFITTIFLFIVIYYAVIVSTYYRKELSQLNSGSLKEYFNLLYRGGISGSTQVPDTIDASFEKENGSSPFVVTDPHKVQQDALNALLEKLEQRITHAGKQDFVKEELMHSINLQLRENSGLQTSEFVTTIENYIKALVENHCSIQLTTDEVTALWK